MRSFLCPPSEQRTPPPSGPLPASPFAAPVRHKKKRKRSTHRRDSHSDPSDTQKTQEQEQEQEGGALPPALESVGSAIEADHEDGDGDAEEDEDARWLAQAAAAAAAPQSAERHRHRHHRTAGGTSPAPRAPEVAGLGTAAAGAAGGTPLRATLSASGYATPRDVSAQLETAVYSPAELQEDDVEALSRPQPPSSDGQQQQQRPPLARTGFVGYESGGVGGNYMENGSQRRRHRRRSHPRDGSGEAEGGGDKEGAHDLDRPGTPVYNEEMQEVASRTKGSERDQAVYHASENGSYGFSNSGTETDEDGTMKRSTLPLFSCMENRDDPGSWKLYERRRHAFQRPLHLFQCIAFVLTLLGFLFHFTAVVPATVVLYKDGHKILPELVCFTVIGVVGSISVYGSWLIVSFRENGDTANEGGLCCYCRVRTDTQSKHCKACNKCVAEFDHHCKWLNMCIGSKNYKVFMWYVTSAVVFMTYAIAAPIALLAKWWGPLGDHNWYYRIGPIILIVIMAIGMPPIAHLFGFHIMLNIKGVSTYEYIIAKRTGQLNRPAVVEKRRKPFPCCCCKAE